MITFWVKGVSLGERIGEANAKRIFISTKPSLLCGNIEDFLISFAMGLGSCQIFFHPLLFHVLIFIEG